MSSLVDVQAQKLTPEEQRYLRAHPQRAQAVLDSKVLAYQETLRRFGALGQQDAADAFRHCYWLALLTVRLGYLEALRFIAALEAAAVTAAGDREVHFHNQRVGLAVGRAQQGERLLSHLCLAAWAGGQLKVATR